MVHCPAMWAGCAARIGGWVVLSDPEHSRSQGRGRHGAAGRRRRPASGTHPQRPRDGLDHGEPMPSAPTAQPVLSFSPSP